MSKIPVYLTIYEWHVLLNELEERLRICNQDTTNARILYDLIAKQLHEVAVKKIETTNSIEIEDDINTLPNK